MYFAGWCSCICIRFPRRRPRVPPPSEAGSPGHQAVVGTEIILEFNLEGYQLRESHFGVMATPFRMSLNLHQVIMNWLSTHQLTSYHQRWHWDVSEYINIANPFFPPDIKTLRAILSICCNHQLLKVLICSCYARNILKVVRIVLYNF